MNFPHSSLGEQGSIAESESSSSSSKGKNVEINDDSIGSEVRLTVSPLFIRGGGVPNRDKIFRVASTEWTTNPTVFEEGRTFFWTTNESRVQQDHQHYDWYRYHNHKAPPRRRSNTTTTTAKKKATTPAVVLGKTKTTTIDSGNEGANNNTKTTAIAIATAHRNDDDHEDEDHEDHDDNTTKQDQSWALFVRNTVMIKKTEETPLRQSSTTNQFDSKRRKQDDHPSSPNLREDDDDDNDDDDEEEEQDKDVEVKEEEHHEASPITATYTTTTTTNNNNNNNSNNSSQGGRMMTTTMMKPQASTSFENSRPSSMLGNSSRLEKSIGHGALEATATAMSGGGGGTPFDPYLSDQDSEIGRSRRRSGMVRGVLRRSFSMQHFHSIRTIKSGNLTPAKALLDVSPTNDGMTMMTMTATTTTTKNVAVENANAERARKEKKRGAAAQAETPQSAGRQRNHHHHHHHRRQKSRGRGESVVESELEAAGLHQDRAAKTEKTTGTSNGTAGGDKINPQDPEDCLNRSNNSLSSSKRSRRRKNTKKKHSHDQEDENEEGTHSERSHKGATERSVDDRPPSQDEETQETRLGTSPDVLGTSGSDRIAAKQPSHRRHRSRGRDRAPRRRANTPTSDKSLRHDEKRSTSWSALRHQKPGTSPSHRRGASYSALSDVPTRTPRQDHQAPQDSDEDRPKYTKLRHRRHVSETVIRPRNSQLTTEKRQEKKRHKHGTYDSLKLQKNDPPPIPSKPDSMDLLLQRSEESEACHQQKGKQESGPSTAPPLATEGIVLQVDNATSHLESPVILSSISNRVTPTPQQSRRSPKPEKTARLSRDKTPDSQRTTSELSGTISQLVSERGGRKRFTKQTHERHFFNAPNKVKYLAAETEKKSRDLNSAKSNETSHFSTTTMTTTTTKAVEERESRGTYVALDVSNTSSWMPALQEVDTSPSISHAPGQTGKGPDVVMNNMSLAAEDLFSIMDRLDDGISGPTESRRLGNSAPLRVHDSHKATKTSSGLEADWDTSFAAEDLYTQSLPNMRKKREAASSETRSSFDSGFEEELLAAAPVVSTAAEGEPSGDEYHSTERRTTLLRRSLSERSPRPGTAGVSSRKNYQTGMIRIRPRRGNFPLSQESSIQCIQLTTSGTAVICSASNHASLPDFSRTAMSARNSLAATTTMTTINDNEILDMERFLPLLRDLEAAAAAEEELQQEYVEDFFSIVDNQGD